MLMKSQIMHGVLGIYEENNPVIDCQWHYSTKTKTLYLRRIYYDDPITKLSDDTQCLIDEYEWLKMAICSPGTLENILVEFLYRNNIKASDIQKVEPTFLEKWVRELISDCK